MAELSDREYRRAFYPAVDVQQGYDPRQRKYYVPIYDRREMAAFDIVPRLFDAIDFSVSQSVQLVSGFRGCGKTSELMRLIGLLEAADYRVAYIDIKDYFNPLLPLDETRLPYALAAGFARAIDADPSKRPIQRFREFLERLQIVVEPTAHVDVGLASIDLKAVVRDDTSFASQALKQFKNNRLTVRREFHAFFSDLVRDLSQPVVFIVDSIDHWRGVGDAFEKVRQSVEEAFIDLAEDLALPNIHVIYTVPVYLQVPTLGTTQDVVNIKVMNQDGSPFEPGITALSDILRKRAPDEDLTPFIGEADLRRLVLSSGGMLRDLLRLARQLLLQTRALPATATDLDQAEMTLRDGYASTLTREHLEILRDVEDSHQFFVSRERASDEAALITLGAVLRYPNAEKTWYAAHPLIRPLIP